jgi:hypothetical protein
MGRLAEVVIKRGPKKLKGERERGKNRVREVFGERKQERDKKG